jgi:hypothetical protein
LIENIPEGMWIYTFADKSQLTRKFTQGIKTKDVEFKTNDLKTFLGETRDDLPHGPGIVTYSDGTQFRCEYVEGRRNGSCSHQFSDGASFTGKYQEGERIGLGMYQFPDGSKYDGEYLEGVKSGQGLYSFSDGSNYKGEFQNNLPHGLGIFTYSDGTSFTGRYEDGIQNGEGGFKFTDGGEFIGTFANGLAKGQGTYIFKDGSKYVGEFDQGKRNGKGVYTYSDGETFIGEFKEDRMHSFGTFFLLNESNYTVELNNGLPLGPGKLKFSDGREFIGEFKDVLPAKQKPIYFPSETEMLEENEDGTNFNRLVFQYFKKAKELGTFRSIPANTWNPSTIADTDPFPMEEVHEDQYDSTIFNSFFAQAEMVGSLEKIDPQLLKTQNLPQEHIPEDYDVSGILKLSLRTKEIGEPMKTPDVDQQDLIFPEEEKFEEEIQVQSLTASQIKRYLDRTLFTRTEASDTSITQNSIYPIGSSFSIKDSAREPSDETMLNFLKEASVVSQFRDLYSSSRDNISFEDGVFLGEYQEPLITEQSISQYLEMTNFDWGFMNGKQYSKASEPTLVPGKYPFEQTHIHGIYSYFDGEILYGKPYRNSEDDTVITFNESEWVEKERSYNIDIRFTEKYRGDREYQQKTYVYPDTQAYAGSF